MKWRYGIDLGGSHLAVGLVEKDKILVKKEIDFSEEDRKKITNVIEERIINFINEILMQKKITYNEIESIGLAVPR